MKWYRCLAEVPGLSYRGSAAVNRYDIPEHAYTPTVENHEVDGKQRHVLMWPGSYGSMIPSSPARERMPDTSKKPGKLLRKLEEALELPGELVDYHFLIQNVCGLLYWQRRDHPGSLEHVERLAHLNVELVEAYPEIIEYEPAQHYRVETFFRLVLLYEREGELREALNVAERGVLCHQDLSKKVEDLRGRLATLEAEDAS